MLLCQHLLKFWFNPDDGGVEEIDSREPHELREQENFSKTQEESEKRAVLLALFAKFAAIQGFNRDGEGHFGSQISDCGLNPPSSRRAGTTAWQAARGWREGQSTS